MKRIFLISSLILLLSLPCSLSHAVTAPKTISREASAQSKNSPAKNQPASQTAAKNVAPKKVDTSADKTRPKPGSVKPVEPAATASAMGAGGDTEAGSVGAGSSISPLLSESFQTDLATGSATANIPIVVPPGRKNMQPSIALSYSSNNPNGLCGVGWGLSMSSIQRSTKKGVPKYDNTDTFVFSSSGSNGELVLINAASGEYRQKIETGFMKYVYDGVNLKWAVWDKSGTKYTFGSSADSRIVNSDNTKIFAWFLDKVEDVYGNAVLFTYEKDGGQIYLLKVDYTANASVTPGLAPDKQIEFVYEPGRPDVQHNYRSGWDIVTAKRLKEIQVKVDGALSWRYVLGYELSGDTNRSLLAQITLSDASGASLPPKKFRYQTIE